MFPNPSDTIWTLNVGIGPLVRKGRQSGSSVLRREAKTLPNRHGCNAICQEGEGIPSLSRRRHGRRRTPTLGASAAPHCLFVGVEPF